VYLLCGDFAMPGMIRFLNAPKMSRENKRLVDDDLTLTNDMLKRTTRVKIRKAIIMSMNFTASFRSFDKINQQHIASHISFTIKVNNILCTLAIQQQV